MGNPALSNRPQKLHPTIACCGLDCGLCPRYHAEGPSRCPGCAGPSFYERHPSCGKITCCAGERGLEVCSQCDEFPCDRYHSWLAIGGEEGGEYDSFLTYRKVPENLERIRTRGLEPFLVEQMRRMDLLEEMLAYFNDGRSKSFYCIAATLLPVPDLESAIEEARRAASKEGLNEEDFKARAKILKALLRGHADADGVELKLRKKK
ncbi:MAG TPA: DUF3795 domain-containing protein [Patescibacteria group bacterium]|nr:DUF3795 domain-containing protein [Patescibacteria group bacterium]